jgi:hypothetical protein
MENYQPSPKPTYTISMVNTNGSYEFPRPETLPQAGDVLVAEKAFRTKAGYLYQVGSRLRLIERTQDAPYRLLSSLGNWVVECPYQVSVWTNIELMVAEGTLVSVEPNAKINTMVSRFRSIKKKIIDFFLEPIEI